MNETDFSSLPLHPALLQNLAALAYHQMTPIQAESLPTILAGKDVIAQAKTGSGKTAAFSLGLLQKLQPESLAVQSLILCPTRELAEQVVNEIRKLARRIPNVKVLSLCGGKPFGPQLGSLEHGAHIVVGTPGRIEEHLQKRSLNLSRVTTFVLDEADRMLDMGFQETLDAIVDYLPRRRQNLLFSATFPEQIQAISQRIMAQAIRVTAAEEHDETTIEQTFCLIKDVSRQDAARLLLLTYRPNSTLIFCNTKKEVRDLAEHLNNHELNALALHGDLEQREREQTLALFANKSVSILVATDVAARGLDIEDVDLVINYQIARETSVHTHRVGRTGRAGRSGKAITIFDDKEQFKLDRIAELLRHPIVPTALPDTSLLRSPGFRAPMATLEIDGGRKQKLRPGDILGALTADDGLKGSDIGKIHLFEQRALVAVKRDDARTALTVLNNRPLKGRKFRARIL